MKMGMKAAIVWWSLPFRKATERCVYWNVHMIFTQRIWYQGLFWALLNLPFHAHISTILGIYVCTRQSPNTIWGGAGSQASHIMGHGQFASLPKFSLNSSACNNLPSTWESHICFIIRHQSWNPSLHSLFIPLFHPSSKLFHSPHSASSLNTGRSSPFIF